MPWRGPTASLGGGAGKHNQQQPWRALWVCRNPWAQGLLLPFAYLAGGGPGKHASNNLGGRYGYTATPGPRGCSCLLPILPEAQRNRLAGAQANMPATTLVGAMGIPLFEKPQTPKCNESQSQEGKMYRNQSPEGQNATKSRPKRPK